MIATKLSFIGTLKPGDEIFLIFPNHYFEGKVVDFDEMKNFIQFSDVKISGKEVDKNVTLNNINDLPLIGWGKKEN